MAIEIHRARSTEADQLTTIAIAAKRHWGYPDRWIDLWDRQLAITPKSGGVSHEEASHGAASSGMGINLT